MATERISHERAALELQALNKRQKGGWLHRWIQNNLQTDPSRPPGSAQTQNQRVV